MAESHVGTFNQYSPPLGEDAVMVLNRGAALDTRAGQASIEAMAHAWSSTDWRGRPQQGGARPEVRDAVIRVGKSVDPDGITFTVPDELTAQLSRAGHGPNSPVVAWIVFSAAIATDGYIKGFASRREFELLTNPFDVGNEIGGVTDLRAGQQVTWPRAAHLGDAGEMSNLGVWRHANGQLGGEDGADIWLRRAAAKGSAEAMFSLGTIQFDRGVRDRSDDAEFWWRQAAELGHPESMNNLAVLMEDRRQIHGPDSADFWWRSAAQHGHANSMRRLGMLRHEYGLIDGPDGAEHWWTCAFEAGNANACVGLAIIAWARGDAGVCERWLERGAALGDEDAIRDLRAFRAARGGR